MKTQEELRAELARLVEADMLAEAEAVLQQLEPLSDEEWLAWHEQAPVDDEPLSPQVIARLEASRRRLAEGQQARAG